MGALASNGDADTFSRRLFPSACFVAETVLTMFFLLIIMGSTDKRAPQGFAPIAIGLGLTLIHLIGIPVTNLSVNPARSTGPAISSADGRLDSFGYLPDPITASASFERVDLVAVRTTKARRKGAER